MKKLTKGIITAVMTAALTLGTFTACTNLSNGLVEKEDGLTNLCTVVLFSKNATARTILPTDFDLTDTTNHTYKYTLTGTSSIGTSYTSGVTPIELSGSNTFTVNLPSALWKLDIQIFDDTTLVLKGSTTIDLTNGASNIAFTLYPAGTANSTVDFGTTNTVEFDTGSDSVLVSEYTISLVDFYTGLVVGTETVPLDPPSRTGAIDKSFADVAPGDYNIIIEFRTSNGVVANFSENVIVVGGTDSVKEAATITNFLGIPTKPSNFVATLVENTDEDINNNRYQAKFEWTDNSNNETEWQIKFTDTDTGDEFIVTKEDTENRIVDGSLNANSKTVTLYLPTGQSFTAELLAVNVAVDTNPSAEWVPCTPDSSDFGTSIVRTTINYDLAGGTLVLESGSKTGTYKVQVTPDTTDGVTIQTLNSTATAPYAFKTSTSSLATAWVLSDGRVSTALAGAADFSDDGAKYKGIKDITLTTAYTKTVTLDVYNFRDIPANAVEVTCGGAAIPDAGIKIDMATATAADKTIEVTVDKEKINNSGNNNFTKFYVEYGLLSGAANYSNTSPVVITDTTENNKITISTDSIYTDGILSIKVIAYDSKSGHYYDIVAKTCNLERN